VTAVDPGAEAHFERGTALLAGGDPGSAAEAFAAAARLRPGWMAPLANRGIALHRLGRQAEAEAALVAALDLKPDNEVVITTLAGVLHARGRHAEAAALAERGTMLAPDRPEPWINLGLARHAEGRLDEAAAADLRALAVAPDSALATYNLAHVRNDQWRSPEALAGFQRAAALDPAYLPARHALLFNLLYSPAETEQSLHGAHAAFAADLRAGLPRVAPAPVDPGWRARRLRIGYVSPDFRAHSCACFLRPLFAAHDRDAVSVHAYALVERPDGETAWFRGQADQWRDVTGLAAGELATLIRTDGIDVLVDLAGHTRGQPLAVFALRPAPVQVAWLGYPATTGLAEIDARFTDDLADPPGAADRWHAERLVRLPGGFLCYEAPADAPGVAARDARPVTLGSFNNISKITPETVAAWSRILESLPGSRLVLKGQLLVHEAARATLTAAFAAAGVEATRIELRPWLPRGSQPLAAYRDIDVALDTFPYNGTTTTFEALWMGVPVVTLRGQRHAARVGASILTHLGRPEWIAEDVDGYVATALGLAADLEALAVRRRALRDELRRSGLCAAPAFARRFEAACRALLAEATTRG